MKTFKLFKVISAIVVSTSMCAGTTLPVFALPETTVLTEDTNGSTYTLTYDENCDEDITVPKDQTCKSGDSIKVSKDKPKRDGYEFVGWSTNQYYVYDDETSKDDEEFFKPNDKITLTEDTTLYAVWEIKEEEPESEPLFKFEELIYAARYLFEQYLYINKMYNLDNDVDEFMKKPVKKITGNVTFDDNTIIKKFGNNQDIYQDRKEYVVNNLNRKFEKMMKNDADFKNKDMNEAMNECKNRHSEGIFHTSKEFMNF